MNIREEARFVLRKRLEMETDDVEKGPHRSSMELLACCVGFIEIRLFDTWYD